MVINHDANLEISHVTTGVIGADTLIAVRYADEQIKPEHVQKELPAQIFTFTPKIEGKAYWEDTHTLVFEPAHPLYDKAVYHAVLDYSPYLDAEPVEFSFETLGQRLLNIGGHFELDDPIDQGNTGFSCTMTFSEALEPALLRAALQLELDGERLDYELTTTDNRTFTTHSDGISRDAFRDRTVQVQIAAGPIALGRSVETEYVLAAVEGPLRVVRIEEERISEFSQLRIIFNETLNAAKDYAGYMSISPTMKYSTRVDGNSLIVTGDFRPREKYAIRLFPGIEGQFGQSLPEQTDLVWEVQIADRKPAVEFVNTGTFLTSEKDKRITFRTINVKRLRLQVKRVMADNLIAFFEENSYRPHSGSHWEYNRYRFQRFGEILADTIVEVDTEGNKWIQTELDLSPIITDEDSALYIVQLNFEENQALYFPESYSDWEIWDHVDYRGNAVAHLMVSDIGITAKEMLDEMHVFLTDLMTTLPLADASVFLKDGKGQIIDESHTNESGWAVLSTNNDARYIEVRSGEDFALLALGGSQLNNSLFDVGGLQRQDGIDAFLYTERGVYRPGDEVNLSAIVRNEQDTFPNNHPVTLRVYNPQGRLIYETVNTQAQDGLYTFKFRTDRTALTGRWQGVLEIGGRLFSHDIRIEEIVPYRIRVGIASEQERLTQDDRQVDFTVDAEYLFGAPATGLQSETSLSLEHVEPSFAAYQSFTFGNESLVPFHSGSDVVYRTLDGQGQSHFTWDLPELDQVPAALRVRIDSRVYESGGRFVPHTKLIPLEYYPSYVGIETLESPYMSMGDLASFRVIHVQENGELLPNSELEYTIYGLRTYWWWEYYDQSNFRRHYKSNQATTVLERGTVVTNSEGVAVIEHRLSEYGEILLEVGDPEGGHTAGYFFSAFWWGDSPQTRTADIVHLKLDQDSYRAGDQALITLDTPAQGRALVTVEKDGKIYDQAWYELTSDVSTFQVEVVEEYIPNAYVTVTVYQPFGRTENDLPLRMYGILPLYVESEGTQLGFEISLPESVRPEEEFQVEIQTSNAEKAQFTLAVVDEGILDITRFATPRPWEHFFAKQRLLTKTYDNFSDIIDLSFGYNHNLLSVGGDGEGAEAPGYRELQAQAGEAMRFEPVSLFVGPCYTDETGYAVIDLEVPNYIGSLRVMVVGAREGRYGHGEETVSVKSPLMVLPTLPRVLGPLDRIQVPVTVFAMEENLGKVDVTLEVKGPVQIIGDDHITLDFGTHDRQEVFFELQAKDEMGVAEITVSAFSAGYDYRNTSRVELGVRPPNPYLYLNAEKTVESGDVAYFEVPKPGISGTDSLQLTVSSFRGLSIRHRLNWLIRYPYGCLEQITSAVFPQLYLAELYAFESWEVADMDQNINSAIQAFSQYQLEQGGFAYWPNGTVVNEWATNYAGHFLLEARRKGYHIPHELLADWVDFQVRASRENRSDDLTQAYRLYLLALAGYPELGAMNYMRENRLGALGNPAKYLLAGAYELLGYTSVGAEIIEQADLDVPDYDEFGQTFGSTLRDKAVILDVMVGIGEYNEGLELYNYLAQELSSNRWYSTQSTAYGLMAMTKYMQEIRQDPPLLSGLVGLVGGENMELQGDPGDLMLRVQIEAGDASQLVLTNTSKVPVFATLEWEGIPKQGDLQPEQRGFALRRTFVDEEGEEIDIRRVQQGESFYAIYQVVQQDYESINQVALVQILPAGWEIENLRLVGGELPSWSYVYNLGQEDYVDIRDDRIMWFFDKHYTSSYDFIVKINAVTVGEFYLPPTLLEAMYNNDYKVVTSGEMVEVWPR